MNYNNKITKLNLMKFKRSYFYLSFIIILACIFAISITVLNDSLLKTEEQQRKEIYGYWHIAIYNSEGTLINDLKHHATMKTIGKMSGFGYVLDREGLALGAIGATDNNAVQMGLALIDGRFPEKDNEMAVEMSYLSTLGYSYELGQAIPLKIQIYNRNTKRYEVVRKTYVLSGIVKNYSSLWKTEGQQLLSFFVNDTSLRTTPIFEHAFCYLKAEYVDNADELSYLCKDRGVLTKNDYTYYSFIGKGDAQSHTFLSEAVYILIFVITAIFFIFNILNISLKEHNKSFVVMRCLGASKNQITILYCRELASVLFLAFPAGILLGIFVSLAGKNAIRHYINRNFVLFFNIEKVILSVIIIIFLVILFIAGTILCIRSTPLTGNVNLQPEHKRYGRHRRKLRPLTVRHIAGIFNSSHRKETIVRSVLTIGTFLVLSSTFYGTYQKYKENLYLTDIYPYDYGCGIMLSYYEPKTHISEDILKQIKNIYGIDYVRAYKCSNYLRFYWTDMEESNYAEYLKNNYFSKYAGDSNVCTTVFGLSDDLRDYKFYIDEIDEGKVSLDNFLNGTEVIVYLPTFYQTQDGRMLHALDTIHELYEEDAKVITEDTINVGDELIISGYKGDVTVRVAGIIYNFKDNGSLSYISKPYSIICNYALYDRLTDEDNKRTYEYLQIYTNKYANYERTDVEVSKVNNDLHFNNLRIQKKEAKYNATVSVVISLLLSFITISITAAIQYNSHAAKIESEYLRNHILYILGMSPHKIQMIYLYNIIKNCFFAVLIGCSYVVIRQAAEYMDKTGYLGGSVGLKVMWIYIFKLYFSTLSWVYVGLFVLGYLIMNILISFYPLQRNCKIK